MKQRSVTIDGIDDLALTTNGSLLARHAQALRDAGLRRLTISWMHWMASCSSACARSAGV